HTKNPPPTQTEIVPFLLGSELFLRDRDGFSFSAGLIDYVINWNLATKPWLIIPIGLCFAVVYYVIFRFAITKFDLKTPGREPEDEVEDVTKV
ncbi:hypothetical protein ACFW2E_46070, partial [Streptomyces sp. NPDC058964]